MQKTTLSLVVGMLIVVSHSNVLVAQSSQPKEILTILPKESGQLPGVTILPTQTITLPCETSEEALPEEPAQPPAPMFGGPLLTRTKLTGDWGGVRDNLAQRGITLDVSWTQFYQGVTNGGQQQIFRYGGRGDYYLNIDAEKAGLTKGTFITLHAETLYGQSVNGNTGAFLPVSLGQVFPKPGDTVTALTGVKVTQFLSENFLVYAGKINLLDELKQPFASGRGVDAFMNTGLLLPITLGRTVPYSTYGAGFAILQNLEPIFAFSVFDTNNTPTRTGFGSFFEDGTVLLAQATLPTKFMDLPGHQSIGGSYSNAQYFNLEPIGFFNRLDGINVVQQRRTGSWSLFYLFDQALWVSPENPKQSWGLFGSLGLADDNPNPIRWSGSIGLGGSSPFTSRKLDTFGIGYFYVGLSDSLKQFAPRLLPLRDEHGFELFYSAAVTPWCRITPDFQVVLPGRQRADTAVIAGIRSKIDF
jgi:porin